jgi:hypothetical protein
MDDAPVVKHFGRGDRVYVQAQQVWLILVGFVMNSERNPKRPATLTYGDLAERMGYPDRRAGHTLSRQLGIVGKLCTLNDLPALNAIVVNQDTLLPGADVLLRPGKSVKEEQSAIMKTDWNSVRVPTTGTFRRAWEIL